MKVTAIQHAPTTGIGLVGSVLERRHGFSVEVLDATRTDFAAIDPHGSELFVILGSPRGAYERHIPWIEAEFHFTRRLLDADAPLFGICFGGQMIASALGAKVTPMGERHRGWRMNDVIAHEAWKGPWLRWHGDSFEVPDGAELLAASDGIPQGFQMGRAVGVQFHPEVDAAIVSAWVREDREIRPSEGERLVAESIRQRREGSDRLDALVSDIIGRCSH